VLGLGVNFGASRLVNWFEISWVASRWFEHARITWMGLCFGDKYQDWGATSFSQAANQELPVYQFDELIGQTASRWNQAASNRYPIPNVLATDAIATILGAPL